jgi:CheY-like chemotaxis protein
MPRVLFLEDEPYLVDTLPTVLENKYRDWQLEVVGLASITQALARLADEEFDAVLLDISMPPTEDMDFDAVEYGRLTGVAVAKRIKEVKPDLPIVALTVVSDESMKQKMLKAGIETIINKPADIDLIAQTLFRVTR